MKLWSADRYEDQPVQPSDMIAQYEGDNLFPMTIVDGEEIVGHILLRLRKRILSGKF